MTVRVATANEMRAVGVRLASMLQPGDLVLLSGELGAGKTTLAQGIGDGLDVRGPVTSPTFVIARVHPPLSGGPPLVHVDAYRIGALGEVDDLDLDTSLAEAVTVVEWGEGKVEGLADTRLEVVIHRALGEAALDGGGVDDTRTVQVVGVGDRWAEVIPADLR